MMKHREDDCHDRSLSDIDEIEELKDGWFTETDTLWPGQKFSLALEFFNERKSTLFYKHSGYQDILVFRSAQYGNVLALDGVIQLTERDEFAYHETMVHIPLCSHPNPKSVLIVGGGDGGVLREVCRHKNVQNITMVEIDQVVIDVCKTFFSKSTATSFDDSRLSIVNQDAAQFIKKCSGEFDVIIGDTSDPVGPAESLFKPSFYEDMYNALCTDGIICMQAECFWIHLDLIGDLVTCCVDIFDSAAYASTMIPTYPCGQIGFVLGGKGRVNLRRPVHQPSFLRDLKWYSPEQHRAAFVLPPFVAKRITIYNQIQGCKEEDTIDKDCFLGRPGSCVLL